MTAKHTPGPWRYKPWSATEGCIVATTDKQKEALVASSMLRADAEFVISLVNCSGTCLQDAAPDLLEALKAARDNLANVTEFEVETTLAIIDAAIAAAKVKA